MIKVSGRSLLFCFTVLFLVSCNSINLSDEEAIRLIRDAEHYPKLVYTSIDNIMRDSSLYQEINRLIKEGYLVEPENVRASISKPTEKGKDLIAQCFWNGIYDYWEKCDLFTHQIDVARITDRRIDKKSGTAIIEYEIVTTTTPYFARIRNLDSRLIDTEDANLSKPAKKEKYFQKWEKGWRAVSK